MALPDVRSLGLAPVFSPAQAVEILRKLGLEELTECALRLARDEGGVDPLLSTLARLRQERLRLEADMRLLIAYGRRFTHPGPTS